MDSETDMDFRKKKLELPAERFAAIAASISREFDKL